MNFVKHPALACCFLLLSNLSVHAQEAFSVPDTFDGFTAEEVQGWVSDFTLPEALPVARPALWFTLNASQVFPTAIIPNRHPANDFEVTPIAEIGKITSETELGTLSLDDFVAHKESGVRGFVVIHEGKVVYVTYLRMQQSDHHLTASASKVFAALVIDVLIDEGRVDESATVGSYVEALQGSAWADISVGDVMDMSTGLDPIDGPAYFSDPSTVSARLLTAEMGGSDETMIDAMRDAVPVGAPGEGFTYSSTATQAFVLIAEGATVHQRQQCAETGLCKVEWPVLM